MKTRLVSCDREWTSLTIIDKSGKPKVLCYNEIEKIKLGYHTEKKLFTKKTSEKIEFVLKDSKQSIILTKIMDWDYFDQYKREVIKFAKDNKISVVD
ncbi:hypothetical protein [Acetivibrio cellulolyticus]|uniref:hypothetical protein n=1 Tax=Acetivibrio cellulolyticus TaxID=35830 RepID=UPI0001E2D959|nr:hypothetical protein [Acetivibrio cellulolyticus]